MHMEVGTLQCAHLLAVLWPELVNPKAVFADDLNLQCFSGSLWAAARVSNNSISSKGNYIGACIAALHFNHICGEAVHFDEMSIGAIDGLDTARIQPR
mgnify:CR=1 FL=1